MSDNEKEFLVKVSGEFSIFDSSQEGAENFIHEQLCDDRGYDGYIDSLSMGDWYDITLEDIENTVSDIKEHFKDTKVNEALDMLVRHFKELVKENDNET